MTPEYPNSIGKCIDLLSEIRERKRDAEKLVKLYSGEYKELEDHILHTYDVQDISKASGDLATGSRKVDEIPTVENWDEFWEFCQKTDGSHLVQKRPSTSAVKELWEAGQEVPGVGKFTKISLNLRNK